MGLLKSLIGREMSIGLINGQDASGTVTGYDSRDRIIQFATNHGRDEKLTDYWLPLSSVLRIVGTGLGSSNGILSSLAGRTLKIFFVNGTNAIGTLHGFDEEDRVLIFTPNGEPGTNPQAMYVPMTAVLKMSNKVT